jgi:hypothetical protein
LTNVVILNSEAHRHLRIRARPSARLGDNQRFVAVIIGEFPVLAAHYPIFLSKDAETGAFYAGAMLGIDQGENLFLDEETGFDGYRPLNLQRAPFFAAGDNIAVDLDSPRIAETDGEALFDDSGAPSAYLQGVMSAFQQLKPGAEKTRAFIDKLLQLKLIEPVSVDLAFDDGTRRMVEDLYTINQDNLRALPDDAVLELFRSGYLHLISLMIASLKQVQALARRKNRRLLDA